MPSSLIVFMAGAVLVAGAAFWLLRAWRRADPRARPAPAFAVIALMAVATLGTYLAIGQPDLPDGAYTARLTALQARAKRADASFTTDELLALLEARAKADTADAQALIYRGDLLLESRDPQGAARAYDAALRRDPDAQDARMGLGRALVAIDQGRVSPQALEIFRYLGERSDDPAPWIYQAMAAMQANQAGEARRLWGEAYRRMAQDDPRRDMARQMSRGENPVPGR